MGNLCKTSGKTLFKVGEGAQQYEGDDANADPEISGNVYMVLCGSNYDSPACRQSHWGPIDQYISAQFIEKLINNCDHITEYRKCLANEMTKENVVNAITEMCSKVGEDDTFFLYYAGHGDQLDDTDGEEAINAGDPETWTGKDQAMVLLNPATGYQPEPRDTDTWLVDDELAELITSTCAKGAKIIACVDCCHSGGMLDLEKDIWDGFHAVSIAGCASKQVSRGGGEGSYYSHSLSAGLNVLQNSHEGDLGEQQYTVAEVYNALVNEFNSRYAAQSDQSLTMKYNGITPDKIAWPLVPNVSVGAKDQGPSAITYAAPKW